MGTQGWTRKHARVVDFYYDTAGHEGYTTHTTHTTHANTSESVEERTQIARHFSRGTTLLNPAECTHGTQTTRQEPRTTRLQCLHSLVHALKSRFDRQAASLQANKAKLNNISRDTPDTLRQASSMCYTQTRIKPSREVIDNFLY